MFPLICLLSRFCGSPFWWFLDFGFVWFWFLYKRFVCVLILLVCLDWLLAGVGIVVCCDGFWLLCCLASVFGFSCFVFDVCGFFRFVLVSG